MDKVTDSAPPPPPSVKAQRIAGLRFVIGLGLPLLLGAWLGQDFMGGFAALGAMYALASDTRQAVVHRLGGIALAITALFAAAAIGSLLRGHEVLEWLALGLIVFLTGLPRPEHAFLGYVGRFSAAAIVLVAAGFPVSAQAGLALLAGGLWAMVITAFDAWLWRTEELGTRPLAELRQVFAGDINSPRYAGVLALCVVLGTLSARHFGAIEPGWVGLTVLFVMHVKDSLALRRMADRLLGTLIGFVIAWALVKSVHAPEVVAMWVLACAYLFPISLARSYLAFSAVVTVLVLLVIDLLLAAHGGDLPLLRWRVYDTVLGGLWAAGGLLLMRALRARHDRGR